MQLKGNYWLDLLERENAIRYEIELTIRKMIGDLFYDYDEMMVTVRDTIRERLKIYGSKHNMGIFNFEYDLDLRYDMNYRLMGYEIKFVYLDDDVW